MGNETVKRICPECGHVDLIHCDVKRIQCSSCGVEYLVIESQPFEEYAKEFESSLEKGEFKSFEKIDTPVGPMYKFIKFDKRNVIISDCANCDDKSPDGCRECSERMQSEKVSSSVDFERLFNKTMDLMDKFIVDHDNLKIENEDLRKEFYEACKTIRLLRSREKNLLKKIDELEGKTNA